MLSRKVATARTGNEMASCSHVSRDSHQSRILGGGLGVGFMGLRQLLLGGIVVVALACDPASDYQFNYDGYGNGQLVVKVPVGWTVTVQCANHSTVNQSCAVVADASA